MENTHDNDFISSSNIDVNEIWQEILEEIAKNISSVSFDVWIQTLELVDIKENTIILATPTKSSISILNKQYKSVVLNACF